MSKNMFINMEGYQTYYKHLFSDYVLPRSGKKPNMKKIKLQAEMTIDYSLKSLDDAGAVNDSYLCLRD